MKGRISQKYIKAICVLLCGIFVAELFVSVVVIWKMGFPIYYFACQVPVLSAIIIILVLIKKMVAAPIAELEEKLLQLYVNIPEKNSSCVYENVSVTDMLEDILAYQEQLINTELLNKYLLKESELSELQSQINPHFLFNTLESIRGFAYRKGVPEIAKIAEAMSSLFRSSIQSGRKLIPLYEELENVNSYITIQKFRFPGRFEFHANIDDKDTENLRVPNLTIQPIVENAIYHGLETKVNGGCINLDIFTTGKRMIIRVTDDGVGIPVKVLSYLQSCLEVELPTEGWKLEDAVERIGIGILNIHKRIRLQFGQEYGVTIASTVNVGTEVEITLPILLED